MVFVKHLDCFHFFMQKGSIKSVTFGEVLEGKEEFLAYKNFQLKSGLKFVFF